jgi:uncharacterized protein YndB with AHSA1/START domain
MSTAPISVSVRLQLPPQMVWKLWNDPAQMVRWNAASDDWHTPVADNDLRVGGKLQTRMEARDGSFGFDFEAVYEVVDAPNRLVYRLGDGRGVELDLRAEGEETVLTQRFEPEKEFPVELQQQGWQAILDNFKRWAEAYRGVTAVHFAQEVRMAPSALAELMLQELPYRYWTAVFDPSSHYVGDWKEGSTVDFLCDLPDGRQRGTRALVANFRPGQYIRLVHQGLVEGDTFINSGAEAEAWLGLNEIYSFSPREYGCLLTVDVDVPEKYADYLTTQWPLALARIRELAETQIP